MDKHTHNEIVKSLPEISGKIYEWLNVTGLYAEAGFSDCDVSEIAHGTGYTENQVKGAIAHLNTVGLTFSEEWNTGSTHSNRNIQMFIHTYLHEEQVDGLTIEEYRAELNANPEPVDGVDYDSRQGIGIDEQ